MRLAQGSSISPYLPRARLQIFSALAPVPVARADPKAEKMGATNDPHDGVFFFLCVSFGCTSCCCLSPCISYCANLEHYAVMSECTTHRSNPTPPSPRPL